ncbi:MAG: biopolymer transporter ExbD [Phycisphaeraceae bacterium]|nr:MAG: biopolymer transporter ExbD [Phycisphaeraceae bacterium]
MNFVPKEKRRMRSRLLRMEMTPMIDVIFLLLIYFFLTSSYTPPESSLTPALQAERISSGAGADFQPQIVEVALVNGRPVFRLLDQVFSTQEQLQTALSALPKEPGVFIRGSGVSVAGHAVSALQAARDAGFERVTYVPARD